MAEEPDPGRVHGTAFYHRGYTGRDYHVTGGHEPEALAARRAKRPNRVQRWVLRVLGYKKDRPDSPS